MPLAPGTRLGPYEISAPLGAGGMGEVYRARDTRLERTVAVKILPGQLSNDPVRRQRFEREARLKLLPVCWNLIRRIAPMDAMSGRQS